MEERKQCAENAYCNSLGGVKGDKRNIDMSKLKRFNQMM